MISHQKAVNFATALFDLKGSEQQVHQRQEDLKQLSVAITEAPELLAVLGNPRLAIDKKLGVLEKILGRKLDPHVEKLIMLMIKQRKARAIRQVASEYHKLVVLSLKEIDVVVSAAEPLNDKEKEILQDKLDRKFNKKINIIEQIDRSLLGGFTLLVHNQLMDLSIKGKLTNLKKQLLRARL